MARRKLSFTDAALPLLLALNLLTAAFAAEPAPAAKPADTSPKTVDCVACQQMVQQLKKEESTYEEYKKFLGKNREFLTTITPDEASKFLKVQGNLVVILKKMNEIKVKIQALHTKYDEGKCATCPGEQPQPMNEDASEAPEAKPAPAPAPAASKETKK